MVCCSVARSGFDRLSRLQNTRLVALGYVRDFFGELDASLVRQQIPILQRQVRVVGCVACRFRCDAVGARARG